MLATVGPLVNVSSQHPVAGGATIVGNIVRPLTIDPWNVCRNDRRGSDSVLPDTTSVDPTRVPESGNHGIFCESPPVVR